MFAEVVVDRPIVKKFDRRSFIEAPADADMPFPEQEDSDLPPGQDANPLALTFHYHVLPHMERQLQVGHLVAVPFRTQQVAAIVVNLSDTSPVEQTKPIAAILDPIPALAPAQLGLAQWLSRECLAPLALCARYFLPPGSGRKPEWRLKLAPASTAPTGLLPAPEQVLLAYLRQQKSVPLAEVDPAVAESLVAQGLALKEAVLGKPKVGAKIDRMVELLIPPEEVEPVLPSLGRPSKQAEVLLYLAELDDPLPALADVLAHLGCAKEPLKALAERGWVEIIPKKKLFDQIEEPERVMLTLPTTQLTEAVITLRGAQKQAAVLRLLAAEDGPVWVGWVYAQTNANLQTLHDLAAANFISINETRRWRDPLAGRSFTLDKPPELTAEQQAAWQEVSHHWPPGQSDQRPILLHGVTGSGKTEIYLRAMAAALRAGQGVIMLVPEITLATQTVERVSARFPGKVAIWHSDLSPGERYDTWERVRAGELPLVVGPRSALFAPVKNLGVIVVDEEHEPVYKQRDRAPIFHAREAALELGRLSQALVILGSATPDVVTYRRAERGEYRLLTLPYRILAHTQHLAVQQALLKRLKVEGREAKIKELLPTTANGQGSALVALPLPQVEVVDMREELKAGNRTIFSRTLQDDMRATLRRGEQVILFLNRRGAASFVICRDCGYVMACPRCETTLTYHTSGELMICHYCGYRAAPVETCPECHQRRIRYFGLGTQRVEEAARAMFPQAKIIRWDWDTTRQKGSHDLFLRQFMTGEANIMVGTQIVAKGLDLPLVTLVGVISADTALYLPDFRAAERSFQLLMQVAGRAGRSPLGGRVIVQTYNPDQVAIEAAADHDYEGFYRTELAFRREQNYPPFKRLALLLYTGPGSERSAAEAQQVASRLRRHIERQGLPAVEVIGPTPGYVRHVRNQHLWHILVRAQNPAEVLRPLMPLPPGWRVDIDPVTLL